MLSILGILLVLAAAFGGYILEKSNLYVLVQPAELLIVDGAAAGNTLIANLPSVIAKMLRGAKAIVFPQSQARESFLRALRMLYEVFAYVHRGGAMKLESDVEDPTSSPIFSNYPELLKDAPAPYFLCDSLRMLVIGGTTAGELDHSWIWISKSSAGVATSR